MVPGEPLKKKKPEIFFSRGGCASRPFSPGSFRRGSRKGRIGARQLGFDPTTRGGKYAEMGGPGSKNRRERALVSFYYRITMIKKRERQRAERSGGCPDVRGRSFGWQNPEGKSK